MTTMQLDPGLELVFVKVNEALLEGTYSLDVTNRFTKPSEVSSELDEIETLRQMVLEVSEPHPQFYTTT
jgi:hypothetical protein